MKKLDAIIGLGCTTFLAFYAGAFTQEWNRSKRQRERAIRKGQLIVLDGYRKSEKDMEEA